VLALLTAALALYGCGGKHSHRGGFAIDERRGEVAGITIGSPASTVVARLGRPSLTYGYITPVGTDPVSAASPGNIFLPRSKRLGQLRYRSVSFLATYRTTHFVLASAAVRVAIVTQPGSRTSRGVRIGDPIAKAQHRYRGLICGRNSIGEDARSEWPYCAAKVGRHLDLGFGGDPIKSITLANVTLLPDDRR
jgi:hypothetical protein